jgi:hypothetical protein
MNPIPPDDHDHVLDRLLESLNRFNQQQEAWYKKHAPDDVVAMSAPQADDEVIFRQDGTATLPHPAVSSLDPEAEDLDDLPVLTDIVPPTSPIAPPREFGVDIVQPDDGADTSHLRADTVFTFHQDMASPPPRPHPVAAPKLPPRAAVEDVDDPPVLTDIAFPEIQIESLGEPDANPLSPDAPEETVDRDSEAARALPVELDDDSPQPSDSAPPSLDMTRLRDDLLQSLRTRLKIEIPTLVEAALQSALPNIIEEIRQGLEENVQNALRDIASPR